jgi:hypothetical protein
VLGLAGVVRLAMGIVAGLYFWPGAVILLSCLAAVLAVGFSRSEIDGAGVACNYRLEGRGVVRLNLLIAFA